MEDSLPNFKNTVNKVVQEFILNGLQEKEFTKGNMLTV